MSHTVTDGEGTLLSLVERAQPITVYEISKIYAASPVTNFGTSKGKLYPMVRRLKEMQLLQGTTAKDRRKTEHLQCTKAGREALREWTKRVDPAHSLIDDPLRTRVQSLHLLSKDEQVDWLRNISYAMEAKLNAVEEYMTEVDLPLSEVMRDHVRSVTQARLRWAERTIETLNTRSD